MILYRGGTEHIKNRSNAILQHFGTQTAAAHRLESMFAAQYARMYNDEKQGFEVFDKRNGTLRNETVEEGLKAFCNFMEGHIISEVNADIFSPLRINDCWQDDPIGSGGLDLFKSNNFLSNRQIKSLEAIFNPFSGVIWPQHVSSLMTQKQIKDICKLSQTNQLFKNELNKRKDRLMAIGTFSPDEMYHEAVWIHLTLKFRLWAIENNYDSFVYQNIGEGGGEDSYVTLQADQILEIKTVYKFDSEKYLWTVVPIFKDFMREQLIKHNANKVTKNPIGKLHYMLWAGQNPTDFLSLAA